jgi:integrase
MREDSRKCFVFKHKRRVKGKTVLSKWYYGRYRLPGDIRDTTIALRIADEQAAKAKLRRIVKELELEGEGLIPSRKLRDGLQQSFLSLVTEYVTELARLGRNEKYVRGVRKQLETLGKDCAWRTVKDVNADSFLKWRQRKTLIAKTLNEYLISVSALLNWAERFERIASNPLRHVTRIESSADPTFKRRALTDEEARRLLAVSGARATVYLTAIKTGLRRGELEKLEWRDVQLDGEPFLNVRAATTKNGKAAPIPIDGELSATLSGLRGDRVQASDKVFESLPRIALFRADLAKAEILSVSPSGERVDFHALRMTFQMRLTLNGVSPRVVMEAMRHSDMKLTAKTYTDAGMLPTREAVCSLPPLLPNCTPIRTPDLGVEGLGVSSSDTQRETVNDAEIRMDTGFRHDSAQLGTMGHENGNGARCRVRTCDFLRVKQALYH